MRKRSPVVIAIVGFAVLLGILLVVASTRRAVHDPAPDAAVTVATFAPQVSAAAPRGASTSALGTAPAGRTPTTTRGATSVPVTAPAGMGSVRLGALPPEARETMRLIDDGGPFPYQQDGVVFENREKHLPRKASGYYHEYTVVTPGSSDRGTRRIIVGDGGERFYTADHYVTFRLIVP